MILEFAKHILTPAPPILKEMGYLRELIAIESREKRCHDAWLPHCESSKQAILEFCKKLKTRESIAILGAALLNDVPLAELALQFRRVELVDILHLPSTRTKAAMYENVVCVECDVTDYVETMFHHCQHPHSKNLPMPGLPQLYVNDITRPSCIVSANILSQLPIMPCLYAERKAGYSESDLLPIKQQLIQQHIQWLEALSVPSLLVADHEEILMDSKGKVVRTDSSTYSVPIPYQHSLQWNWLLAPQGEEYKEYSVTHVVRSYTINMRDFPTRG